MPCGRFKGTRSRRVGPAKVIAGKRFYYLTGRPTKTVTALARYKHRIFRKGKTYTVRRKLTEAEARMLRTKSYQKSIGWRMMSVRRMPKRM